MTPKKISQIIEKEINGDWSISNAHGCDLKKCLIRPKRRALDFHTEIRDAWIVLEEDPINLDGFMVYFDEKTNKFGLAQHSEGAGYYGYACNKSDTFIAAFKSM
jgi:hypothetical protein